MKNSVDCPIDFPLSFMEEVSKRNVIAALAQLQQIGHSTNATASSSAKIKIPFHWKKLLLSSNLWSKRHVSYETEAATAQ